MKDQTENPQIIKPVKRDDVYSTESDKKGAGGFIEKIIRKFKMVSYFIALAILYFLILLAMGISVTPGVYLFMYAHDFFADWPQILYYFSIAFSIVLGFFLYGLFMIFVIPAFNFLMPFRVKPFRGSYFSLEAVPWYFHNAFIYVVRYTFLEFFTPTPLNILFYKMMGMKIGEHVHINTTNISDAALIEIGDKVTIGGSATIFAHYASKGFLVVEKVRIGTGATVGIKATIMGDVEIGEGVLIGPHEVVMPKSRILSVEK
jgi:hypothetical protein